MRRQSTNGLKTTTLTLKHYATKIQTEGLLYLPRNNRITVSFNTPIADNYSHVYPILIHESNASVLKQLHEAGFSMSMTKKGTGSIEVLTSNNRVMKRYEFYRNQKITVIDCRYFSIETASLETAARKVKELCADGQLDELSNDPTYQEDAAYQIPGTEYPLDIENNNGDPTVMIYSAADGACITDNLPKRSAKCLPTPARRGGTDNPRKNKSDSGKNMTHETGCGPE